MAREVADVRAFEGQEGSRWINKRPSGSEVAEWFKTVPLHDGMDHERYVGGITLISAREEVDVVVEQPNGSRALGKRGQIVFTPYPKVETRIAYFLDWLADRDQYVGWIEPVEVRRQKAGANLPSNEGLPPGFFYSGVLTAKGVAIYLCCTQRLLVFERASYAESRSGAEPMPVLKAEGTKAVPVLRYPDRADDNAIMKAETGAKGRALGFAGMLIVPGAGVATAEDMQESNAADARPAADTTIPTDLPASSPEEAARDEAEEDRKLRDEATRRIATLKADFPEQWNEITAWAREREMASLSALSGAALRGFVRKLDKALDEALAAQAARGEGDEGDPLADVSDAAE